MIGWMSQQSRFFGKDFFSTLLLSSKDFRREIVSHSDWVQPQRSRPIKTSFKFDVARENEYESHSGIFKHEFKVNTLPM
jgi:hypothetical protein